MIREKRFNLIMCLVVINVVLTIMLVKVTKIEFHKALVISTGLSMLVFLRTHAIIGYLIERKR